MSRGERVGAVDNHLREYPRYNGLRGDGRSLKLSGAYYASSGDKWDQSLGYGKYGVGEEKKTRNLVSELGDT